MRNIPGAKPLQSSSPVTRTFLIPVFCFLTAASAQQPLILLDPARGGGESGVRIADRLTEKQVTLDLAGRIASLLRARGFAVAMTREADVDVTNDARAALANSTHPIACILLHATASGSGVHLYTTAMHQKTPESGSAVRWDEAQAAYADRSRSLEEDVKSALQRSGINASSGRTWVRPLDNMQCPAVAIEVAPHKDGTGAEDRTYQSQVANALANTLLLWRGKMQSMAPAQSVPAAVTANAPAITPPVTAVPKPIPSTTAPAGTPATSLPVPRPTTPKPKVPPAAPAPAANQPDGEQP